MTEPGEDVVRALAGASASIRGTAAGAQGPTPPPPTSSGPPRGPAPGRGSAAARTGRSQIGDLLRRRGPAGPPHLTRPRPRPWRPPAGRGPPLSRRRPRPAPAWGRSPWPPARPVSGVVEAVGAARPADRAHAGMLATLYACLTAYHPGTPEGRRLSILRAALGPRPSLMRGPVLLALGNHLTTLSDDPGDLAGWRIDLLVELMEHSEPGDPEHVHAMIPGDVGDVPPSDDRLRRRPGPAGRRPALGQPRRPDRGLRGPLPGPGRARARASDRGRPPPAQGDRGARPDDRERFLLAGAGLALFHERFVAEFALEWLNAADRCCDILEALPYKHGRVGHAPADRRATGRDPPGGKMAFMADMLTRYARLLAASADAHVALQGGKVVSPERRHVAGRLRGSGRVRQRGHAAARTEEPARTDRRGARLRRPARGARRVLLLGRLAAARAGRALARGRASAAHDPGSPPTPRSCPTTLEEVTGDPAEFEEATLARSCPLDRARPGQPGRLFGKGIHATGWRLFLGRLDGAPGRWRRRRRTPSTG